MNLKPNGLKESHFLISALLFTISLYVSLYSFGFIKTVLIGITLVVILKIVYDIAYEEDDY